MISSEVPYPFAMSGDCGPSCTSTVSKKLRPAFSASSMIWKLVASSLDQAVTLRVGVEAAVFVRERTVDDHFGTNRLSHCVDLSTT